MVVTQYALEVLSSQIPTLRDVQGWMVADGLLEAELDKEKVLPKAKRLVEVLR